jgi:hypothetical protein
MVEVCGKKLGNYYCCYYWGTGFFIFYFKTTTAGVKMERAAFSVLCVCVCVVRAGCFFASPAACIDFLVFEARQSEFFLLRHALLVLQWMFL